MNRLSSPAWLLFGLILGGLLSDASAVVRRHDKPDSSYLKLGGSSAFSSVGRVEIDYGRGYQAIGTATLFGADRLVSAAHVFSADALAGAQGARIKFGSKVQYIDFRRDGVVNINPGYDSQTLRNDVSVVFLAHKFTLAPATFYTGKRLALNTPITFVGYGDTGTGLTGSDRFSIAKRGGQNAVGRYLFQSGNFEIDFDRPGTTARNSLGSSRAQAFEGLLGPGDSGGSAWVRRGKKWEMVGINSYGVDWFSNGVEDDYGDRSGFIYVPKYTKWINSLENPGTATSFRSSSQSLSAVPEPTPIALIALAGASFLIFRRRPRLV